MKHVRMPGLLIITLLAVATGCSPREVTPVAATATSFSDPFAYCAAVGTIDAPDAHYTGERVPDAVINGFKNAAGWQSSSEPSDVFKKATIWRCVDRKVYACNFGANLTCDSKADMNKVPTQAMNDYCKANPNTDFIPMAVTGHATVFSWRCEQDQAQVGVQISQVDAQGYIASIWYPIQP